MLVLVFSTSVIQFLELYSFALRKNINLSEISQALHKDIYDKQVCEQDFCCSHYSILCACITQQQHSCQSIHSCAYIGSATVHCASGTHPLSVALIHNCAHSTFASTGKGWCARACICSRVHVYSGSFMYVHSQALLCICILRLSWERELSGSP